MGQLSTKLESKHMLHIYKRLYKTVSAGRQLGWGFFLLQFSHQYGPVQSRFLKSFSNTCRDAQSQQSKPAFLFFI